jgi:hypothetical protein
MQGTRGKGGCATIGLASRTGQPLTEWATRNPMSPGKEPPALPIGEGSGDLVFDPVALHTLGEVVIRRAFGARQAQRNWRPLYNQDHV